VIFVDYAFTVPFPRSTKVFQDRRWYFSPRKRAKPARRPKITAADFANARMNSVWRFEIDDLSDELFVRLRKRLETEKRRTDPRVLAYTYSLSRGRLEIALRMIPNEETGDPNYPEIVAYITDLFQPNEE
jgi:hypothetical protein